MAENRRQRDRGTERVLFLNTDYAKIGKKQGGWVYRRQRTEDRRQKTEDRRQKTEDRELRGSG